MGRVETGGKLPSWCMHYGIFTATASGFLDCVGPPLSFPELSILVVPTLRIVYVQAGGSIVIPALEKMASREEQEKEAERIFLGIGLAEKTAK